MTHDKKIDYLRIASGICGFGINNRQLDLLVSLYELILEKEGKADVDSMVGIEYEVKNRHDAFERSRLIDKVSEKISTTYKSKPSKKIKK